MSTRDFIQNSNASEIKEFVRNRLKEEFKKRIGNNIRNNFVDFDEKYDEFIESQHLRFDMSGYGTEDNSCYFENLDILKLFADCGIWDHVAFLYLDAYKGSMIVYWQWWENSLPYNQRPQYFDTDETHKKDYSGETTTEIISDIIYKLSRDPKQNGWDKRRFF